MPFNLGFFEMVVIFIVALLVVGPRKLPDLGKSLGKSLREFRKATEDLKSNWEEQVREAETSVSDVRTTLNEVKSDIEATATLDEPPQPPAETVPSEAPAAPEEAKPNDAHAS
jgi:Tat protein translocase TatB subunit